MIVGKKLLHYLSKNHFCEKVNFLNLHYQYPLKVLQIKLLNFLYFFRPKIGDRFQVQGAEYWKKRIYGKKRNYADINGTIVYKGEVDRLKIRNFDIVNIENGTLVFVREENSFVINVDGGHFYRCDGQLDGAWKAVTSTIRIRFFVRII